MANQPIKKQDYLNLFLNDYFNIILAVVLILFLIASYFIFLAPKFQSTQEAIRVNTEEKQILFETTQKRLANLKALQEVYSKINPADLQKFNSVLPDNYVRERLYGELDEVISSGGWILSSVEITPSEQLVKEVATEETAGTPAQNKKIGTVQVRLSISAIDYAGFKKLLRVLESNLRLFDITDVQFSPSSGGAGITLTTYYYQSL